MRLNPAQEQARVDVWNEHHPIGTEVVQYKLINPKAEPVQTKTRSEAWLIGGHTGVVKVDGISGGVPFDALELIDDSPHKAEDRQSSARPK